MGNKVNLLAALALYTGGAAAADINTTVSTSRNETGYITNRLYTSARNGEYGAMITGSWWSGDKSYSGAGIGLDVQKYSDNWELTGYITVNEVAGKNFKDMDMSFEYRHTGDLKSVVNVSGDTLASDRLAPGQINFVVVTPGVEWTHGKFGVYSGYRMLYRSDSSNQVGPLAKLWWQPRETSTIYVFGRTYHGDESNELYFSPIDYSRYGIGFTERFSWSRGRAGVTVEQSMISVNGVQDSAIVFKFNVDGRINNYSRLILNAGRDYSTTGNYTYNFAIVQFKASF